MLPVQNTMLGRKIYRKKIKHIRPTPDIDAMQVLDPAFPPSNMHRKIFWIDDHPRSYQTPMERKQMIESARVWLDQSVR